MIGGAGGLDGMSSYLQGDNQSMQGIPEEPEGLEATDGGMMFNRVQ